MTLADDAAVQRVGQGQHGFDLVLHHAAHRNAGPVRHHRSHGLRVDGGQDQRGLTLQRAQAGLQFLQRLQSGRALGIVGSISKFAA